MSSSSVGTIGGIHSALSSIYGMSIISNYDVRKSTYLMMSCHFGAAFGGIAFGAYYFVHELFKVGIDDIGNVQFVMVV